jgi:nitrogen fixation protein NifU and related proteins
VQQIPIILLRLECPNPIAFHAHGPASRYNGPVYSSELLDHFEHPRNPGEVEQPDSTARLENPVCGDILELSLKLQGDRIADIRFRAKGCVPSMACGSAITELAKGKTVEEARAITREDLLLRVGGVPEASTHAAALAMDSLAAILRQL